LAVGGSAKTLHLRPQAGVPVFLLGITFQSGVTSEVSTLAISVFLQRAGRCRISAWSRLEDSPNCLQVAYFSVS